MKNPYREGSNYFRLFDFMQKAGSFVRSAAVKFARSNLKLGEDASEAAVTVVMSPRAESKRGDCRGNISAKGWFYYVAKLSRATVKGVKEEQKYRLLERKVKLQPKTRNDVKVKKPAKKPAKKVIAKKPAKKVQAPKVQTPAPTAPATPATPAPQTAPVTA
jgi:hypothetical protein